MAGSGQAYDNRLLAAVVVLIVGVIVVIVAAVVVVVVVAALVFNRRADLNEVILVIEVIRGDG